MACCAKDHSGSDSRSIKWLSHVATTKKYKHRIHNTSTPSASKLCYVPGDEHVIDCLNDFGSSSHEQRNWISGLRSTAAGNPALASSGSLSRSVDSVPAKIHLAPPEFLDS